jgi:hypothetical protein
MSTQTPAAPRAAHPADPGRATLEQLIMEAVRAIRFGSVEITIHDSQVVQIERTEKLRLTGR